MAAQSMTVSGASIPSHRMIRRILQKEAYRRITAGDMSDTLSEFAAKLHAWFKDAYPAAAPVPESLVEDTIRNTWHRRHEMIGTEL